MWSCDLYRDWLRNRLLEARDTLGFNDYAIDVYNEQDYAKHRSIKPKTITVVVKFLSSTLLFSTRTQPIQMLVIAEENGIGVANSIITSFCERFNFSTIADGTTYVKHMYSTPAVLSNFNLIGIGLRTVLYVNTTLFILEDVMDITDLKVDGNPIDALSSTFGYTMSGDTQPFGGGIAETVKDYATVAMTINVACTKTAFTEKCIGIMNGKSTGSGDERFAVSFRVGDIAFSFSMVLTGSTITTAVNNVPSIQLSFNA